MTTANKAAQRAADALPAQLSLAGPAEVREILEAVVRAVANGDLSPSQAGAINGLCQTALRIREVERWSACPRWRRNWTTCSS